jgi:hypothetical protein
LKPFIPNGCTKSPDGWDGVDWKNCCDLHDLAFYEGGFLGGLVPWYAKQKDGSRAWSWTYPQANVGLAKCIVERNKKEGKPWQGRFFGSLYGATTMLVSWTPWHWTWKKREVTGKEWNLLVAMTPQQLDSLRRLS